MNTFPPQFKTSQMTNRTSRLSTRSLNEKNALLNHESLKFTASLDPQDEPPKSASPLDSTSPPLSPPLPPGPEATSPPKGLKKWVLKLRRFKFKKLFKFKNLFSSSSDAAVVTASPSSKPKKSVKSTFIPKVEQLYPTSPLEESLPKVMDTSVFHFEETPISAKPLDPLGLWTIDLSPSGIDLKSSIFSPTLALSTDTIFGDSFWGGIDVKESFKKSGKSVPPSDSLPGFPPSTKDTLPKDIPDIVDPIYVSPPSGIAYSMIGAALMGGLGYVSIANPADLAPPEYKIFVEGLLQGNPDESFFIQEMPKLLNHQPLSTLHSIAGAVESFFDFHPARWGHHPNEAELMLLLKHPELSDRDPNKTYSLTKALTSITRFIKTDTPLTDEMVKAWGEIGS
ncbi:MAG: hypothetical protein K2X66_17725, partial [Cyanobacteria bacterium]|nr:hypothetical protein [Cyanobacteriota bacterium]